MNKYKILRLSYPGVIRLEEGVWINFKIHDEKFSFVVSGFKKGLVVFDPDNEIQFKKEHKLKKVIDEIQEQNVAIHPTGEEGELGFYNITETDPNNGRCFYDQSYTHLFLLLQDPKKKITVELAQYYLNHLFVKYNTSYFKSTMPIPKNSYWEESIRFLETDFESDQTFDEIIKSGLNLNLKFKPASIFIKTSKHGIIPTGNTDVLPIKELKEIPEQYFDVFELYAAGLMQMNYYNNFKLAIIETFVAVEILVVRISDEQKRKRGVSKTKINDYKKSIDVGYRMDVELKLFFNFNDKEELLLGKVTRARAIRNKIMHANYQINEKEIKNIIESINEFLLMLIAKNEN